MRHTASAGVVLLLTSLTVAAQDTASPQQSYRQALALHDSGDYAGAIAIYKELLKADPDNEELTYELTYSTLAKGDLAETIRLATEGARKPGRAQVRYLELLGNAYDAQHQPKEAVDAYQRGIKADPNYSPIYFNLGVTHARQSQLKDAREAFQQAIARDPFYASPHFAIATVYQADGYRVPAMLAFGRFLVLERKTARTLAAATNLLELLGQGTSNPDAKKDLGDFSALEAVVAMAMAESQLSDAEPKSDFERAAGAFALVLSMLPDMPDSARGFIGKTYVSYYGALVKAGHVASFAHLCLAPLNLSGTDGWTTSHRADVAALDQWMKNSALK